MRLKSLAPQAADTHKLLAGILKVLAHPTRIEILEILAVQEACVCHITAILAQRQPAVSQHLTRLRDAGLVLDRREGLLVYYRLADRDISEVIATMRQAFGEGAPSETPTSPVAGCPCPRCARASAALQTADTA